MVARRCRYLRASLPAIQVSARSSGLQRIGLSAAATRRSHRRKLVADLAANQNCAHLFQTVETKEAAPGSLATALRSDTEQSVYELALTYRIALRQPSDLPHPDRMHCLVTIDRYPWRFHRSEFEPRCYLLLDEAMVLHNEVVQIRRCWATAAPVGLSGMLQFADRPPIRQMPIYADHSWPHPTGRG